MKTDEQSVKTYIEEVKTYWATAHQKMKTEDNLYRSEFTLDIPQIPGPLQVVAIKPAKGKEVVNRASQHLPALPKIEALAMKETVKAVALAEKVEDWLYGAYDEDARDASFELRMPPVLAMSHFMFLRGMAVAKTILRPEYLPPIQEPKEKKDDFEERMEIWQRNRRFAIPTYAVDPLLIYIDPSGSYVYEERTRRTSDIRNEAEQRGWDIKVPDLGEVTWGEFWTDDSVLYYIGEELILRKKHGYGFVPYAWAFSGLGAMTMVTDGDDGPHNLAVGLLRGVEPEIKEIAQTVTELAHQRRTNTYPSQYGREAFYPGSFIEVESKDDIPGFLNPPNQMELLINYLIYLNAEVDRKTAAAVLGGSIPSKQMTASETMATLAEARLIIQNPIMGLERLLETVNVHKLRILESILDVAKGGASKDVVLATNRYRRGDHETQFRTKVSSVALRPADVGGWYKTKVTIDPMTPQEEALKTTIAMQQMQAGLLGPEEAARQIGIENYTEQLISIAERKMLDALLPSVVQDVAKQMELEWRKERTMGEEGEMEQMQQQMTEKLGEMPSGMPIPPQAEGQVPGSPAQAAQMLGQVQGLGQPAIGGI